ncbi:hypothetical protein HPB52_001190 [Rhipicephalus sanguineus]|uniref:Uncharacterized protein n=1 Tax=Rhipicephalus sanguineus TaxID=34632 RepID=A0A9D4PTP5_RHISA|nr:hypothetical protein HPB52_001190 [Rhipicephalus sanguineus]
MDDAAFVKGMSVSSSGYPGMAEPTPKPEEADVRQPCRVACEPVYDKNHFIQTDTVLLEDHVEPDGVVSCTGSVAGRPGVDKFGGRGSEIDMDTRDTRDTLDTRDNLGAKCRHVRPRSHPSYSDYIPSRDANPEEDEVNQKCHRKWHATSAKVQAQRPSQGHVRAAVALLPEVTVVRVRRHHSGCPAQQRRTPHRRLHIKHTLASPRSTAHQHTLGPNMGPSTAADARSPLSGRPLDDDDTKRCGKDGSRPAKPCGGLDLENVDVPQQVDEKTRPAGIGRRSTQSVARGNDTQDTRSDQLFTFGHNSHHLLRSLLPPPLAAMCAFRQMGARSRLEHSEPEVKLRTVSP